MSKVTIIIPSYNHENYIKQRLDSIRNQSFKDWEAIIIDDASTDNSVAVIESYLKRNKDFRIKYFVKNKSNSGSGYKSWQKGIALAQTEYIWIAETDDYSETNFLQATVEELDGNPKAVLAFTASNYVDENGMFLYNTKKRLAKLNLRENESKLFEAEVLLNDLPLNPLIANGSSVVFRKPSQIIPDEIFENKQLSDLFLWTYLLQKDNFLVINLPLNNFRRHAASTTNMNFRLNRANIYNEYLGYNNYFKKGKTSEKAILQHYIKHFLIPNRKSVGHFNTKPLKNFKHISHASKINTIIKAYLNRILKNNI